MSVVCAGVYIAIRVVLAFDGSRGEAAELRAYLLLALDYPSSKIYIAFFPDYAEVRFLLGTLQWFTVGYLAETLANAWVARRDVPRDPEWKRLAEEHARSRKASDEGPSQ